MAWGDSVLALEPDRAALSDNVSTDLSDLVACIARTPLSFSDAVFSIDSPPVAVDASTPIRWTKAFSGGSTPDSMASAAFTAPANSFLVVCVCYDGQNDAAWSAYGINDTGSLGWTERVKRSWSETTAGGMSVIWTARTVSAVSRTISVTGTGETGSTRVSAKVYVLTGVDVDGTPVDTVSASNEGGSTTNSINTTSVTPTADGLLIVCDTDWAAGNGADFQASSDLTQDTAFYTGEISALSGYRTCTSGVGITGNLNAGGGAAVQHKWCQIIVRSGGAGASASDVVSALFQYRAGPSDAFSLDDLVGPRFVYRANALSEDLGLSDSVTALLRFLGFPSDSFVPADTVAVLQRLVAITSDEFVPTDTASAIFKYLAGLSDALGATDNVVGLFKHFAGASDAVGLTDDLLARLNCLASISEALVMDDSASGLQRNLGVLSDTVPSSDLVVALLRLLAEVSDALSTNDQASALFPYLAGPSDATSIADNVTALMRLLAETSDQLVLDDVVSALQGLLAVLGDTVAPSLINFVAHVL